MSVEAPKTVEETPVVDATKAVPEQTEGTPAVTETSAAPIESTPATSEVTPAVPTEETTAAPAATEELKKDEVVVEAVPTSEGVLGYKEPGFFKKFIFTKHFFWFAEEPSTPESLNAFLRLEKEKAETKHTSAAWARETGKGVLFYAKRSEDKAVPAGVINLSDASAVTKEGFQQFSFKAGNHQHRFEAATSKERDSWIVAVEKAIEEAKEIKDEITGRESYKKNIEEYTKPAVIAPVATKSSRSKSKEPKKSLDAATATSAAAVPAADNASTSSSSSDEATKAAKKDKERSQSRKRGSIFGSLLGKKEEHAEKKEEKAEVKKELKEDKKIEADEKKEEAKASEEPTASNAVEAAEASTAAAAIAAAPAAAVVPSDKKEEEVTPSPTEKKNKRGSVFGSLFKKNVTSPTAEKSDKEATTSDVPPVSETAPKLDEPIENKPIDTAAVTAPADTVETPAATTEEPVKDLTTPSTAAETATTPKAEKKGGILGFIKKTEAKLEGKKEPKEDTKEEHAAEVIAKDPVAAAAADNATETPAATEPVVETPAKEERPARDNQRRTSLFFNKSKKDATSDTEGGAETKREKSPLPGKFIGNLVRRASKAVKSSEQPKEKSATEPVVTEPTKETAVEPTPAPPAPVTDSAETKIIGDVVPETLHATPEPATTTAAPEVKATA